ncbi:fatty acid 2-hydroxylase [Arctopsyche grandis]|uniref:fatty acid 2-hydroxylase n=1 Tax=Arctopsyche grandis TaxID=121162 RepID=UPI00406D9837
MAGKTDDVFNVFFEKNLYNIKKFMKHHPGGSNTLNNKNEKDISALMNAYGHGDYAYYLLEQYKIEKDSTHKQNGVKTHQNGRIPNGLNGSSTSHISNGNYQDINGNDDNSNGISKSKEEIRKSVERMERIENLVDWSKPMLSQLHKLGPHYLEWVHSPVDKPLRMFSSSILESFTFTRWYIVPMFWIPILLYGTYFTYNNHVLCQDKCTQTTISSLHYVLLFTFGILIWTLFEYSIHRWIFHCEPGNSLHWKQLHFLIHGLHHKVPFDELRLVFPPIPALGIATVVYTILKVLYSRTDLLAVGIMTGYLIYDMIHYFIHNASPKDGSLFYTLKRYHASHHFKEPLQGFGISSKLWDLIFDTTIHVKKLNFSLTWK